jgi:hypothetical protein
MSHVCLTLQVQERAPFLWYSLGLRETCFRGTEVWNTTWLPKVPSDTHAPISSPRSCYLPGKSTEDARNLPSLFPSPTNVPRGAWRARHLDTLPSLQSYEFTSFLQLFPFQSHCLFLQVIMPLVFLSSLKATSEAKSRKILCSSVSCYHMSFLIRSTK